jgi:hypothetical protein
VVKKVFSGMQKHKTLSQLFQDEPRQWGLRGDPYLWAEMKAALAEVAYPDTEEALHILLEQTYEELTGESIQQPNPVFVERYSHGGMSSGHVSPQFWIDKGFPMLRERYRQTKPHSQP